MVGLAKNLITAIAAHNYYRSITTEELGTYFKEVEGILNWRPLTAVTSSANVVTVKVVFCGIPLNAIGQTTEFKVR